MAGLVPAIDVFYVVLLVLSEPRLGGIALPSSFVPAYVGTNGGG